MGKTKKRETAAKPFLNLCTSLQQVYNATHEGNKVNAPFFLLSFYNLIFTFGFKDDSGVCALVFFVSFIYSFKFW